MACVHGMQCLGVTARETKRANNLSGFIRTDSPEARIVIKLHNTRGPGVYRWREFGDEICIERRIGKTTAWLIKAASGRKVGSRREDLDNILDALSIDGTNPLSVATQACPRRALCWQHFTKSARMFTKICRMFTKIPLQSLQGQKLSAAQYGRVLLPPHCNDATAVICHMYSAKPQPLTLFRTQFQW